MNGRLNDFTVELDMDWDWREKELRLLKNTIALAPAYDQDTLRRSLIVLLYAHFEGYCKFALQHYVVSLNSLKLPCKEAVSALVAGSWSKIFHAVTSGDEKCKVFKALLPNDADLHMHWRRRHFVEEVDRLFSLEVKIEDKLIDFESNLKPKVLKRNMFMLGLDHTIVDQDASSIDALLNHRNGICHGVTRNPISESDYSNIETATIRVKDHLTQIVIDSFKNKTFKKASPV